MKEQNAVMDAGVISGARDRRIRVGIAAPHPIVREAIFMLLEHELDMEVVGLASDGFDALDLVQEAVPDVLLMDLKMPRIDGFFVLRKMQSRGFRTRVVVLTDTDNRMELIEALKLGCAGILLKGVEANVIPQALRMVHAGYSWMDEQVLGCVQESPTKAGEPATTIRMPRLTAREKEIVRLVAQGFTNRQIAECTSIRCQTVRNHLHSVFAKIGVTDRMNLALYALHQGLQSFEAEMGPSGERSSEVCALGTVGSG